MKIRATGGTDKGRHRTSNEDAYGIFQDINLAIIADGMGGHAAGEIASRLAVETIQSTVRSNPTKEPSQLIIEAIQTANEKILESAKRDAALTGMGTTIVTLYISGETGYIGYAGDSRIYRFRNQCLEQLTEDHSLVGDYIRKGLLTPEEAQKNPLKHVITRALGTNEPLQPDLLTISLQDNDIYLLCSDGLSNMVGTDEIQTILSTHEDSLEGMCKALIDSANEHGGADNITLILLHCLKN